VNINVNDLFEKLNNDFNDLLKMTLKIDSIDIESMSIEDTMEFHSKMLEIEIKIGVINMQGSFLKNYLLDNSQSLISDGYGKKSKLWQKKLERMKYDLKEHHKIISTLIFGLNARMRGLE